MRFQQVNELTALYQSNFIYMSGKRLEIKQIDKSQRKKNKPKSGFLQKNGEEYLTSESPEAKIMSFDTLNDNLDFQALDVIEKNSMLSNKFMPFSVQKPGFNETDRNKSNDSAQNN